MSVALRRLKRLGYVAHAAWLLGRGKRVGECPVCGTSSRFWAFGHPPRYAAECPGCGSFERQRLLALAVREGAVKLDGCDVLHVAPEPTVRAMVEPLARSYRSADLNDPHADLRLDLRKTELPGESVDTVILLHVLEHIPEDGEALREVHRILRPGGALVAMVPIVESWVETYEDSALTSAAQRTDHFGQHDHVRLYGRDFRDRITTAGFDLDEFRASPELCVRHALIPGETVFIARKPSPS